MPEALRSGSDVVASTCLLTQHLDACLAALGPEHPDLFVVAQALVVGHLAALAELTAAGGVALLVTDALSSETYPLDDLFPGRDPLALLAELDAAERLFTGTSPRLLERLLRKHPPLAGTCEAPARIAPWLWSFSEDRTYLVHALSFRRKGAAGTRDAAR